MATFNVVVIAASAGGLDALEQIVAEIPRGFPAAVMVVLHTTPAAGSAVPEILNGVGRLPAGLAEDGERLSPGRIYVAPPDRHMIVDGDKIRLALTPKEHFMRPAADPLFRSAARSFGRRAIGIVLSGSGRDGAEGLAAIKAAGGTTIVQDPKDAPFSSMPLSALAVRLPDHCLPSRYIASLVERLVRPDGAPVVTPRTSLRGLSVLVLESASGGGVTAMLHRLGCAVAGPAADLATALDIVRRDGARLDCAVLDVDLAGGMVYPLAAALRARGVPLLFAACGATVIAETWRWVPRIRKPFDDADLQTVLQAALDGTKPAALPSSFGATAVGAIRYSWETAEENRARRGAAQHAGQD
ncbi:MAG: chemotaxis protein CheB [Gemmatimonas sp.]